MDDICQWITRSRAKSLAESMRNGDQSRLGDHVIWNAQNFSSFFLMEQVERGPTGAQTARPGSQHKAPHRRQERPEHAGLSE